MVEKNKIVLVLLPASPAAESPVEVSPAASPAGSNGVVSNVAVVESVPADSLAGMPRLDYGMGWDGKWALFARLLFFWFASKTS